MTAFLIRKLDATTSTNTDLKQALSKDTSLPPTVIWAEYQSEGKGQHQRPWVSERGKNLTFSLYWRYQQLTAADIFLVNKVVCLALLECLEYFKIPAVSIKWPNDILSGTSKLAGVLIENMFQGDRLKASIIGIGLNVNQTVFKELAQASSMASILGRELDREVVLHHFLILIEKYLKSLKPSHFMEIRHAYVQNLFGLGTWTSVYHENQKKMVKVLGVDTDGTLHMEWESGEIAVISDSKELKWLY